MPDDSRKRVLIIDDASLVRLFYRQALEGARFHVEEALNGLEALEKLLVAPVDLLVVDVNMPRMDGVTFLQTLRGKPGALATIPALVTSTEAAEHDKAAARAAGANFYLVKPIDQATLVAYACLLCGVRHG